MIKTQSEKTHEEIFKKLTETYTSKINKKKSIKNIGELTEIYYSKIKQTWFSLIEDEQKYYYIFGKYDSPNDINPQNNSLIIDFTKTEKYDENCLGIINHKNIYINKINLLKKYPNINLNNFTSKHLLLFQYTYQNISSIDLGHINKDFIENLEKLIKEIVNNPLEKSKNLFLNSIKAGKTVEQSLKIAKISQKELNDWLEFGKNKNNIHHEFYEDYFKLVNSGKSKTANDNLMNEYDKIKKDNKNIDFGDEITETTNIKMNVFLNEYKKDKNLNNSLKKSNIDYYLFNLWIKQGKQPSNKYNKFYKEFNKIRETSKIKKDPKKSSKNSQLMNDFIKLKHEGKTNEEIIKKLEIPEFLVKNWVNQGKLGNVKYIDFYEAYRLNNKPKSKKVDNKKESKIDNKKEINVDSDERKCIICGRTLNKNYKKDICKRCTRKRYAVKILGKLLSSIEPEIPFKQDDLKALNLDSLQIQDYIWTLKEFNLISEKDSKLTLKKREILDKFAEECESEIIIKDNSISLSKTCETCGKTLEISNFLTSEDNEDGYENDCKDCKKLINSAIFLKELNKYIKWDQEFTEEDLTPHFKDPFILKGNIWNLQDNDLIKNNLNSDKYVLTDKKTGMDFIEKYYKKEYDKPIETNQIIGDEKNSIKNSRKIVLDEISKGKTRKEAAEIANIPLYKITHWYNEGRQGFGKENINFYKKLKALEQNTEINQTKIDNSHEISESILNKLLVPLEEKYEILFKSSKMNRTGIAWVNIVGNKWIYQKQNNNQEIRINNPNIYSLYQEVKHNNLPWGIRDLNKAKFHIKNYFDLNKDNTNIKTESITQNTYENYDEGIYAPLPEKYEIAFKSSPMNQSGIAWVNKSGTGTKWSYTKQINGKLIKFDDENIYNLYKKVKNANHIWGIRDYSRARNIINIPEDYEPNKKGKIKDNTKTIPNIIDPDIYAPLPKELNLTFNPSQSNKTGIAWVNKAGNRWVYSRKINGKTEQATDENIYELHKKVKYLGFDWGIRNYDKAKKIIKIPENYQPIYAEEESTSINTDIYAPLPNRYMRTFNPKQENKSGIAWVNRIGNKWVYQRKVDGNTILLKDSDIINLHEIVIKNNHIWGIINYEKAKKVIENEINDEYEDEFKITPIYVFNNEIIAPLSDKFNPPETETGIAWVEISASNFIYSRIKNGQRKEFGDTDLNRLFNKVIFEGLEWGIIDYKKASKYINIPKDFSPEKYNENRENNNTIIKNTSSNNIFVNYLKIDENNINIIIRGIIKNNEFIDILNKLKSFENNFKRIITNSFENGTDIFIELNLNSALLKDFEEVITEFNWKINK